MQHVQIYSPKFVAAFHRTNIGKLLLQASHRIPAVPAPLPVENTLHHSPGSDHCCGQDYKGFCRVKVSANTTSQAEGILTSPLSHSLSGHKRRHQTSRTAPRTLIIHSLGDKSRNLFLGMVSTRRKLGLWGILVWYPVYSSALTQDLLHCPKMTDVHLALMYY